VDNLDNLKKIIGAIQESGERVIFPAHPRTRKQLKKIKLKIDDSKLKIINPLGYLDMLYLEKFAKKIITDSGGIQKEAYWFKIPCITLMESTGWPETVKNGWNILINTHRNEILRAIKSFNPRRKQHRYFGSGKAAEKIVKILINEI
jgi:UDP-N-acetylglucosamine 2-epimerase